MGCAASVETIPKSETVLHHSPVPPAAAAEHRPRFHRTKSVTSKPLAVETENQNQGMVDEGVTVPKHTVDHSRCWMGHVAEEPRSPPLSPGGSPLGKTKCLRLVNNLREKYDNAYGDSTARSQLCRYDSLLDRTAEEDLLAFEREMPGLHEGIAFPGDRQPRPWLSSRRVEPVSPIEVGQIWSILASSQFESWAGEAAWLERLRIMEWRLFLTPREEALLRESFRVAAVDLDSEEARNPGP